MKPFKFFKKPFNTKDYDIENFRFLGVSPITTYELNRPSRTMIYVHELNGDIVPANIIYDDHDAYHEADVYDVRGNQVFLRPRQEIDFINVSINIVRDES